MCVCVCAHTESLSYCLHHCGFLLVERLMLWTSNGMHNCIWSIFMWWLVIWNVKNGPLKSRNSSFRQHWLCNSSRVFRPQRPIVTVAVDSPRAALCAIASIKPLQSETIQMQMLQFTKLLLKQQINYVVVRFYPFSFTAPTISFHISFSSFGVCHFHLIPFCLLAFRMQVRDAFAL